MRDETEGTRRTYDTILDLPTCKEARRTTPFERPCITTAALANSYATLLNRRGLCRIHTYFARGYEKVDAVLREVPGTFCLDTTAKSATLATASQVGDPRRRRGRREESNK